MLGYTEPDSGSDAAAAKTRAVADGDEWVINGQKMFTSTAHVGTHVFLLTRTNTDVPKHRGLTMFMVPLGRARRRVPARCYTLGGQRTNATFYSRRAGPRRLPHRRRRRRLGRHAGRARLRARVAPLSSGPSLAQRVAEFARGHVGADGRSLYDEPGTRELLARTAIDNEVGRLLALRNRWAAENGVMTGIEGAAAKLWLSEKAQRQHAAFVDLLGAEGTLVGAGPLDGVVEHEFRNSVVGTIYGGSTEIMREIVAERRLKLPRSRPLN